MPRYDRRRRAARACRLLLVRTDGRAGAAGREHSTAAGRGVPWEARRLLLTVVVVLVSATLAVLVPGTGWGAIIGTTGDSDVGRSRAAGVDASDERDGLWIWPTEGHEVLTPWGDPVDQYAPGHRGIDIAAAIGSPAHAPDTGVVTFAGPVAGRTVVVVDHGGSLRSTLDAVAPSVAKGDRVVRGQVVGTVAADHCPDAAPCVHLGARIGDEYVDPMRFLGVLPWPILLPESAWHG